MFNNKDASIILAHDIEETDILCIAAHQDDVEIMAASSIVECFNNPDKNFTAITVTDGAGSPRSGRYSDTSFEEMIEIRKLEQQNAAKIGDFSSIQLSYKSSLVKAADEALFNELKELVSKAKPSIVITHNLADKHETHVRLALLVVKVLKSLSENDRPKAVYGAEVWRGLDWLADEDKLLLDTSDNEQLQKELLSAFVSQIDGGKRYDLATMGRRCANATFLASHSTDKLKSCSYAMDLSPLIYGDMTAKQFMKRHLEKFSNDILSKLDNI